MTRTNVRDPSAGSRSSAVSTKSAPRGAFTLIELAVVIAVIGLLAALLLPALARSKALTHQTVCLNNLKQLQLAWLAYAHDNNDALPPNRAERREFDLVALPGSWVVGNARFDADDHGLRTGVLWRHAGEDARVYHCPADTSTVHDHPHQKRLRSYSACFWLNGEMHIGTAADEINEAQHNARRLSQVTAIGASRVFVFIDEDPASIDDGAFAIGMVSYASSAPPFWSSFPGERHQGSGTLSFADGHVEAHPWKGSRAGRTYTSGKSIISTTDKANLDDWRWVQERLPNTR